MNMKNKNRWYYLLLLFLCSLPVTVTLARYYEEKELEITSQSGRPAITLEAVDATQKLYFTPGMKNTYSFRVKNSDVLGRSEVKMKYRITFETDTENVSYTLKKNESVIAFTYTEGVYKTELQSMPADKEQIDTYLLEADCTNPMREAYLFSTANLYLDSEQAVD